MKKMIGQTEKFGIEIEENRVNFIPRTVEAAFTEEEYRIEAHSYSSSTAAKKAGLRYIEKHSGEKFRW